MNRAVTIDGITTPQGRYGFGAGLRAPSDLSLAALPLSGLLLLSCP